MRVFGAKVALVAGGCGALGACSSGGGTGGLAGAAGSSPGGTSGSSGAGGAGNGGSATGGNGGAAGGGGVAGNGGVAGSGGSGGAAGGGGTAGTAGAGGAQPGWTSAGCKSSSWPAALASGPIPFDDQDRYGYAVDDTHFYIADAPSKSLLRLDLPCGALTPFATGFEAIRGVAIDATYVYFSAGDGIAARIYRVTKTGGSPQQIISEGGSYLLVDAGTLFWIGQNGIRSAPANGGAPKTITPPAVYAPFAVTTQSVVFPTSSAGSGSNIQRTSRDGGNVTTLAQSPPWTTLTATGGVAFASVHGADTPIESYADGSGPQTLVSGDGMTKKSGSSHELWATQK